MEGFSVLTALSTLWGAVTATLIALVIYRAIVGIHEEDQIFLDNAEAALASEQVLVIKRIHHIDRYVKWFGIVSGVLFIAMAGLWVYEGLFLPPIL